MITKEEEKLNARMALTNLGMYNEGVLNFTWLELPTTKEKIDEAFRKIDVTSKGKYQEYFISDWEIYIEKNTYVPHEENNVMIEEKTIPLFKDIDFKYINIYKINEFVEKLSELDTLTMRGFDLKFDDEMVYDIEEMGDYIDELEDCIMVIDLQETSFEELGEEYLEVCFAIDAYEYTGLETYIDYKQAGIDYLESFDHYDEERELAVRYL